jgi:two-component system, cell cycle sensor histidine kinase and response regulator CckA
MKILIADDNADDRKLLRYNLERHGCRNIIEARDGWEGLDLTKRDKPDLIISDALMPRMDGFQFLRLIKSDKELQLIPFIFYSSVYTGHKEEELARSLGAEAFLTKPQEPEKFWETVTGILEMREAILTKPFSAELAEEKEEFLNKYSVVVTAKLEEKIRELEDMLEQRTIAEQALKESEARYRFLLESVTDYIYTVNIVNNLPVSSYHGPGCLAVTGYSPEEFTDDPMLWYRMVHGEDRPAVLEQANRVISGNVSPLEHRIIHKDGEIRWVRNTPVLRSDQKGCILAYDGLISDITERRKLENQLHHAQKMEALGTLVRGIAHDFNNILMVITGYVNLMQSEMDKDNQQAQYFPEVLAAAERAVNLTRALLTFGKKQEIMARAVNLNGIVSNVDKMLKQLLREDIDLQLTLTEKELVILCDQPQIEQVLMNLAINARDAMPLGGIVTISTMSFEIDGKFREDNGYGDQGQYALLIFSDNGEGMDEQTRQRIFEPFYTTKEVGKGTGLGLAVCHGIITQHNGFINCSSKPGWGTTFKIFLPLITADLQQDQLIAPGPSPRGTETILLAEDDQQLRLLCRELLTSHGYTVIEAVDGEDALTIFHEHREEIGLVIVDGIMPKMNGRDVHTEIKRITPEMKVIIISGYSADVFENDEMDYKNIHFLAKPVKPDDLLQYVRKVLDEND